MINVHHLIDSLTTLQNLHILEMKTVSATGYNGDVVCLQEVDEKVFMRDLKPALRSEGLEGLFSSKGGSVNEGVALFYRQVKLRQVLWKKDKEAYLLEGYSE